MSKQLVYSKAWNWWRSIVNEILIWAFLKFSFPDFLSEQQKMNKKFYEISVKKSKFSEFRLVLMKVSNKYCKLYALRTIFDYYRSFLDILSLSSPLFLVKIRIWSELKENLMSNTRKSVILTRFCINFIKKTFISSIKFANQDF